MSHGPGRIQRAILDAITTPEALTPASGGPMGVSQTALLEQIYGHYPTRSHKVAFGRALKVLKDSGRVQTYGRRWCDRKRRPVETDDWDTSVCGCIAHVTCPTVGRPRDAEEQRSADQSAAAGAAALRAAMA